MMVGTALDFLWDLHLGCLAAFDKNLLNSGKPQVSFVTAVLGMPLMFLCLLKLEGHIFVQRITGTWIKLPFT